MTELIFYGGVEGEVGGNIVEISEKSSSLILDFGVNFTLRRKYYDDIFVRPRSLKELIEVGLLYPFPFLKGIKSNENKDYHIFISHPHSDHYKFISLIKRDVPVYIGSEGFQIINTIHKSIEFKNFENDYSGLNFVKFSKNKRIKIDDVEIIPLPVDHSILGAYSFLVFTPEASIFYTGDIRFHGPRKNLSFSTIDRISNEKIDVVITEATRITDFSFSSEKDVEMKLLYLMKRYSRNGIFMIDVSLLDFDRLSTILNVSRKNEKKILIPPKLAFYLLNLSKLSSVNLKEFFVLENKRYEKYRWYRDTISSIKSENLVTKNELMGHEKDFVIINSFYSPNELRELRQLNLFLYILSTSEPYDEEREISFSRLLNWLEFIGTPLIHLHSSGHADILTLFDMLSKIKPKCIIPVHTPRPLLAKKMFSKISNVLLPKKSLSYHLKDIL